MVNNKKGCSLLFFLLIWMVHAYAQEQPVKHFIYFSDKDNSPFSIHDPVQFLSPKAIARRAKQQIAVTIQDLPVNPPYVDSLTVKGMKVLAVSRWLNGVLVSATPSQIASLQTLPFVQHSKPLHRKGKIEGIFRSSDFAAVSGADYGSSLNQLTMLGIDQMHRQGFQGENIRIAVIDAGFKNVQTLSLFSHLFTDHRIVATYDFIDQETDVYDDHSHGTQVLSLLAAYAPGTLIGGAWKAEYVLLRSEDAGPESVSEEVYWARAAEYADSAGVDIINTSLGYNTFDNASDDHVYADLDGNTTIITQAADIAASKGILVVNSAGNEGNTAWKYVLAPADGDSVLAVGGVTPSKAYFYKSSKGPTVDGRIKPDVVAMGNNVVVASLNGGVEVGSGTSYAAPLVTGLAAGIWQAFPQLSSMDLLELIRRSSSQYTHPDNELGYGIPHFAVAIQIIDPSPDELTVYPNPVEHQPLILNLPSYLANTKITLRFTDITGKTMAEEVISSAAIKNILNTRVYHWIAGFYFLTVTTENEMHIFKILKK